MRLRIQRAKAMANAVPLWERVAEPWPDHDGVIYAYGQVFGNEHWMHLPGLASFRFSNSEEEITAAVTSAESDESVVDVFHRKVLPMAVQVRGREVLHASAIRGPAGVVTFCGTTRSGKSTIAFGLSQRGYSLWADDMVAFEVSDRSAVAVSLPFNPRLRESAARLFAVDTVGRTVARHEPLPLGTHRAPLAVVCILSPKLPASPVEIRRLSSADAFAATLDHACCFFPQGDERKRLMIRNYLELVAVAQVFEISFQPGLTNLPLILDGIEQLINSNNPVVLN